MTLVFPSCEGQSTINFYNFIQCICLFNGLFAYFRIVDKAFQECDISHTGTLLPYVSMKTSPGYNNYNRLILNGESLSYFSGYPLMVHT